jgi:hypothetical protein
MSRELVESVADDLIGTCDSAIDRLENFSDEDLQYFDQICFRCETCGWWHEIGEMSEEFEICTSCAPEDEE